MPKIDELWKDFDLLTFELELPLGFADLLEKIQSEGMGLQIKNDLQIETLLDINEKVNKYYAFGNIDPAYVIGDIADILNKYVQKRDG